MSEACNHSSFEKALSEFGEAKLWCHNFILTRLIRDNDMSSVIIKLNNAFRPFVNNCLRNVFDFQFRLSLLSNINVIQSCYLIFNDPIEPIEFNQNQLFV